MMKTVIDKFHSVFWGLKVLYKPCCLLCTKYETWFTKHALRSVQINILHGTKISHDRADRICYVEGWQIFVHWCFMPRQLIWWRLSDALTPPSTPQKERKMCQPKHKQTNKRGRAEVREKWERSTKLNTDSWCSSLKRNYVYFYMARWTIAVCGQDSQQRMWWPRR